MLKKKYSKMVAIAMMTTCLVGGGAYTEMINTVVGNPTIAYADASSFNPGKVGMSTPTGWITSKIKCTDNIPETATLEQMKSMAIQVDEVKNPDLIVKNDRGTYIFNFDNMHLTDNIYYYQSTNTYGGVEIKTDRFVKILSMEVGSELGWVNKVYSEYCFVNGEGDSMKNQKGITRNVTAYNYLKSELNPTLPPVTPEQPTEKKYSASRLGGATRWETSTAIAKQVNGNKLDAVVLANAYNFPDALTGTTLAGNKKAPILLVGNNDRDTVTLNYIKNNLKSTGKVYVLGGSTAVSDGTLNKVKSLGFKNIKRLGGSDRYATNMSIVNELNVSKGSSVIIANSMSYADSLSISGISGASNMPIFLVNGNLTSSALNKIKSIAPKNIYIVGSTTVVNNNIEKQLKSYGNVVRLGGKDRFETSLKIANYFTKDTQTTALVSYGLNFPDALAGGALASKTSSPILLVNKDVTAQKDFLDKSNINKIFILGDKSVISDSVVGQLTK